MKRIAALFLTVLILIISLMPAASAVVVSFDSGLTFKPGNTRWTDPEYNYAWLDQLFIRDDATAILTKELLPTPDDYPYSHTYEDFIEECNSYISLYGLSDENVAETYMQFTEVLYYAVVAMGFTDNTEYMSNILVRNGIEVPDDPTTQEKMAIAVVYAAIEFNAVYIIYGENLELPTGIALEEALVLILGKLTATEVPAGVDTLSGLGSQAVKEYLEEYDEIVIPLTKNPSDEELFYWLKAAVASTNDYEIPLDKYDEVTNADKEYVEYVYFASVLETGYGVKINPEKLLYAYESEDKLAVHRLVLRTMLEEKGVSYKESMSLEKMFNLACKNGYFALENEFFSDVLKYELEVAPSCEKLWFTPVTLGDQLNGGNKSAVTVFLQNTPVSHGSTVSAALDPTKAEETVLLEVVYNDGYRHESAVYEFKVKKNSALEKTTVEGQTTNLVGQVQDFVDSVIPGDNEKASEVLSGVFGAIDNISAGDTEGMDNVLSTYSMYAETAGNAVTGDYDFDYLAQLMGDMYETDANGNVITTKVYTTSKTAENEGGTIIQKVTQTVAENPEIIAAPTGLLALGGLVGFMMNKKHRDAQLFTDEDKSEENE